MKPSAAPLQAVPFQINGCTPCPFKAIYEMTLIYEMALMTSLFLCLQQIIEQAMANRHHGGKKIN
jgi:hypothetical protein